VGDEVAGPGPASPALMQALAAHPEQMADLVGTLDGRVLDVETLLDLMGRICRAAVRLLDGVGWAGITAQFDGPPLTAAHTDRRVLIVDEHQYQLDDGPCLQAMRTNTVVAMTAAQIGQQWPKLGLAARQNGVHTVLAVPLEANDRPVGALNLYSPNDTTTSPDADVLRVLTEYASRGLADFQNSEPHPDREEVLRRALARWSTVEQAIAILMHVHGFDNDYAHQVLADQAQDWGRTVSDQAAYIVSADAPR
jgi:transcriptional regulator with GAF, ATPase, and Fis domain